MTSSADGFGMFLAKNLPVVFSIISLFPSPKQRAEMVEVMRSVQDLTRPEPGCIACCLCEDDTQHNHLRYTEQWESEEALHDHIRSELYGRVLAAMELSRQPPEVRFYFCSTNKGMEFIENIRQKKNFASPRIITGVESP